MALESKHLEEFLVLGTNFSKADIATRGRFAISKSTSQILHNQMHKAGAHDFFLLSTCNRSEFYTTAPLEVLQSGISEVLDINKNEIEKYFYCLRGIDAVNHFFKVLSGLDSQILGDYEIVSQVKAALKEAKNYRLIGTLTDRISNYAFQASKKIKAQTKISSGKYSVNYTAAELISHELKKGSGYKILVIGAGVFGSTVTLNLRKYFPEANLLITNRTHEKSVNLADKANGIYIPYTEFRNYINKVDAVITTVSSNKYLINKEDLDNANNPVLLDLSIPQAIDPQVKAIENIRLYTVDEVSAFHNRILDQRQSEVPKAERIISETVSSFKEWYNVYYHRDIILQYKEKIDSATGLSDTSRKKAKKTFEAVIQQIRTNGVVGCLVIEALNEIIAK